jgi:hypothetical protein
VYLAGEGAAGVLAAYAALWEPEIAGVVLKEPPPGHMSDGAPQFLNVLRVCDVPDVLGMLAPRPLKVFYASDGERLEKVVKIYTAVGEPRNFARVPIREE